MQANHSKAADIPDPEQLGIHFRNTITDMRGKLRELKVIEELEQAVVSGSSSSGTFVQDK